jgi:hypothetical protein
VQGSTDPAGTEIPAFPLPGSKGPFPETQEARTAVAQAPIPNSAAPVSPMRALLPDVLLTTPIPQGHRLERMIVHRKSTAPGRALQRPRAAAVDLPLSQTEIPTGAMTYRAAQPDSPTIMTGTGAVVPSGDYRTAELFAAPGGYASPGESAHSPLPIAATPARRVVARVDRARETVQALPLEWSTRVPGTLFDGAGSGFAWQPGAANLHLSAMRQVSFENWPAPANLVLRTPVRSPQFPEPYVSGEWNPPKAVLRLERTPVSNSSPVPSASTTTTAPGQPAEAPIVAQSTSAPVPAADITKLADRVYQLLVRRLSSERDRRGY